MTEKIEIFKVRCPRCGKHKTWKGNPHRPFCSEQCKMIDLGRWADGDYRIAGEKAEPKDPED
ncbi:MAG: DNA gyrase inhibitor YacG [Desulfuromonas sp.]|uniref:DNA gyrase inhibitor YacG n=1 Tax=Desulfuromonas sp. TaxID=892 RepID=UPI000CBDD4FE|nr:DNA gyrase inhibitor YacG [Desulfuromonas sp.]PLX81936.1 MAG: DNA gyrase inhibitor YacG [Desulfuromonas sp.]